MAKSAPVSKTSGKPLTKSEFKVGAKPIQMTVLGQTFSASARDFETSKSVGFNINSKLNVTLEDGTVVEMQLGFNLTAIKSKEWAD